ncbi:MAG: hypothetical protein F4139_15760 [Gemmatimonadetes bacterium]|nr:hypothetical protein [Gemmatimonadota bacterium]
MGTMPSTLRYGSGLIDIPVALALPHLAFAITYSGFGASAAETVAPDTPGETIPTGGRFERWFSDGSLALGLFNRVEVGATLQHYADRERGGRMYGAFGRLALLRPAARGLGLATGFRYVTSPSFGDTGSGDVQPNRLGYPDWRVTRGAPDAGDFSGNFSPYLVGTLVFPGFAGSAPYDVTLHAGWGGGLFRAGRDLEFYRETSSGGVFAGAAVHFGLGDRRLVNLMAEFNGFDANAGVQIDLGGIRVGAFALGLQYDGETTFRSRKFGVLGSVAFCGGIRVLCRGRRAPAPDTVTLPAPPPDTVIVIRSADSAVPEGTPVTLCLATGESIDVRVTEAGDTLAGPPWVPIRELPPGLVVAGSYAEGREWFDAGEPIRFDDREYVGEGDLQGLDCDEIVEVGDHGRVPLFAGRSAEVPFAVLYVPVTPGYWQAYRRR